MTFGSLMSWGSSFGKGPAPSPIERYHSGSGGYWEHKSHGHGGWKSGGGKGGGSGAALSALTLLAFLFLLNVMQQSLQENNSTAAAATSATALLLREGQQPVSLSGRAGSVQSKNPEKRDKSSKESRKGDIFLQDFNDREYS